MSSVKVIRGGLLIDGTGKDPLEDSVIVIENSRIGVIGVEGMVNVPQGEVIDAHGKTVIPGLIECHAHTTLSGQPDISASMLEPVPLTAIRAVKNLRQYLEAGYTTVRDCGAPEGIDIAMRKAVEQRLVEGPRLFVCGRAISITGGHGDFYLPNSLIPVPHSIGVLADGSNQVRRAAREQLKLGADWIKLMASAGLASPGDTPVIGAPQLTTDEIRAACDEAHKLGRRVCAHAIGTESIKNAVMGGVDTIEHGTMMDEEAIRMIKEKNRFVIFGSIKGVKLIQTRGVEEGVPEHIVKKAKTAISYKEMQQKCLHLAKAGVKVAPGSDAGCPLNIHGENAQELEMWVEAGFSPMETMVATTKTASEALGVNDRLGTVELGKLADIVIIDGNPLDNISVLQVKHRIRMVLKGGEIVIDRKT